MSKQTQMAEALEIKRLKKQCARLARCLFPVQMGLAELDMIGEPAPDDAVVLSFMGSGASDRVTAGEVRRALDDTAEPAANNTQAERAAWDPAEPLDAMAESFRLQIADIFISADKAAVFRDLTPDRKVEAFMAGALTGVVGCVFAAFQPEARDELMAVITAYLTQAREQAEGILNERQNAALATGESSR